MRLVLCSVLFVINAQTITIKPRSVNLALETVLKFDNRDNSADLQFIDNVQMFLSKVKNVISEKKVDRRYIDESSLKFSNFIEKLMTTLNNYDDEDLEDISAIVSDEIRKYHYENCKFYELLDNKGMRRFVGQKLDEIKYIPAETIKAQLHGVLNLLEVGKLDDNVQEFIDYIDSFYTKASAYKLSKFIDDLKLYSTKSKRANLDLIKIVREGLRSIIFDHYSSLNVNARRDFKVKLETFWNNYMHPNKVKHSRLNVKFTKYDKENDIVMNKKRNDHDFYLKNFISESPADAFQERHLRKRTKGNHGKYITPTLKEYKSYEFAKKIDFNGNRLTLQNIDDLSRSIDDISQTSKNKNSLHIKHSKKSTKHEDINVSEETDETATHKHRINEGRDEKQYYIFSIDTEQLVNKSKTKAKRDKYHKDIVKKGKPLGMAKRNRTKIKYYNRNIDQSTIKRADAVKTKHTKHLRENIYQINDAANMNLDVTAMEAISIKTDGINKINDSDKSTKKAIFLTLYPEDFTLKFKRRKPKNKVTTIKQRPYTIWEEKVTTKKEPEKKINFEEDSTEKIINDDKESDHVNITEPPKSMETLDDESESLRMSKRKKHNKHHKHRNNNKYKKTAINYFSSKKYRKSLKTATGSSDEGISIESFDRDQRHSASYRKNNDFDQLIVNTSIKQSDKDLGKHIKVKNISKITTEVNPKINEINEYGALEFWEGTTKPTPTTAVTKPTTNATKSTTSVTKYEETTMFPENSTKTVNITEIPIKTFGIVLRTNDKNVENSNETKEFFIKNDTVVLPFTDVKSIETNVTTVNKNISTTTIVNTFNMAVKYTTKTTPKSNVSNTKNTQKSTARVLINKIQKTRTNNIHSILTTSTRNIIKTSSIFNLRNFLNQSKIDVEGDKKKLLHEKIMKDMEVIFAPTTPPPLSIAKEATDPFKEIEEALDFD